MTQDEIIEMAAKVYGESDWLETDLLYLEAFAKLVTAKEREACEMACEEIRNKYSGLGDSAERVAVEWCLEAIRARGQA
jgi:hypothetical protein